MMAIGQGNLLGRLPPIIYKFMIPTLLPTPTFRDNPGWDLSEKKKEMIMSSLDQASQTQLRIIKSKTGKSLAELRKVIEKSGLTKHSEIWDMLRETFQLGYGGANALVHFVKESDGQSAA